MKIKYWQAVNQALADSLEEDERVVLYGEDVGAAGGPFGASKGLQERFGNVRVRDTPISEAAIIGSAVGAAMTGLRPIVEIMFMDFMGLAVDQIVNQAAKVSYMSGGAFHAPMVVRTLCGAGRSTGPQHEQSFEEWFSNVPGLTVVWPSDPADAYGLLRAAVLDDNPVIVVESLRLWSTTQEVSSLAIMPLGRAFVRRPGTDVTLVAWGAAVTRAMAAAAQCADHGVSVEVIDLRTISPLDEETVLTSIASTGRLAIIEDGPGRLSVGTRIAALAAGPGFGSLVAPVIHVSSPFAPIPFAPVLEDAYFPSPTRMADAILSSMEVVG